MSDVSLQLNLGNKTVALIYKNWWGICLIAFYQWCIISNWHLLVMLTFITWLRWCLPGSSCKVILFPFIVNKYLELGGGKLRLSLSLSSSNILFFKVVFHYIDMDPWFLLLFNGFREMYLRSYEAEKNLELLQR